MKRFMILVLAMIFLPVLSVGAQNTPYSEESQVDVGVTSDGGAALQVPPVSTETGTPEGRTAVDSSSALIDKLEAYIAARDFTKAAAAQKYIKKVLPGLTSKMKAGQVDDKTLARLKARLGAAENKLATFTGPMLAAKAREFKGYSTRSGPGRGNVACAWLVSAILRSAGIVPGGWHENIANDLVDRMVSEYRWQKIPPTGKHYSGKVASSQMMPGDLVFWSPSEHVGVYLGNGMALSNSSGSARGTIHPVSGYYDGWIPRFVVRAPSA